MKELAAVLEASAELARQGGVGVLATVVHVSGSAYRRPGARMLFRDDGSTVGLVSGGCLEADLARRARAVLDSGESVTVVYDMRSPDDIVWGLGLGCDGEVRVLLERLAAACPPYLTLLQQCRERREPCVVATVFRSAGLPAVAVGQRMLVRGDGSCLQPFDDAVLTRSIADRAAAALTARRSAVEVYRRDHARVDLLVEYVPPPLALVVFGAGSDAVPLVQLAAALGWQVSVLDHRSAYATPQRFPEARSVRETDYRRLDEQAPPLDDRTPAVVMTHHFLHDLTILEFLLSSATPYVGLLGPRRRCENLLRELEGRGIAQSADQRAKIHGPVGLDIGSETPEEIALAVLAEIRAVLSARPAGFLRERSGPLHDWPADSGA